LALLVVVLLCGCVAEPHREDVLRTDEVAREESIITERLSPDGAKRPLPDELFDVEERLNAAFRLKAGDSIEIRVFGREDLTLSTVIPLDGYITFPLVGSVRVAGVSPQEIEKRIEEVLKEKELVSPQVSVLVKSYAPRKVYIIGEVRSPGGFSMQPGERLTLSQLLSLAGGFLSGADRQNIHLMRFDGSQRKVYTLSFSRLQKELETEQDVPLIPGDVILVGKMEQVYVLGCVKSPGGYDIEKGASTLTKVIAMAGGLTRLAARSSIRIIRYSEMKKIRIDIDAVFEGRIGDPVVKEGDVIFVPESLF